MEKEKYDLLKEEGEGRSIGQKINPNNQTVNRSKRKREE